MANSYLTKTVEHHKRRKTGTFSFWVKRSGLSDTTNTFWSIDKMEVIKV